jgi:hypothetical protein
MHDILLHILPNEMNFWSIPEVAGRADWRATCAVTREIPSFFGVEGIGTKPASAISDAAGEGIGPKPAFP